MKKLATGLIGFAIVTLLVSGCSAPELASPETTGFLVVESEISSVGVLGKSTMSFKSSHPTYGEIEAPDGKVIRQGIYGRVIMFRNLAPGRYKLIRLTESNPTHTIRIGMADDRLSDNPAYTVDIQPGKPVYIGVVRMKKLGIGMVEGTYQTTYAPDADAEKDTWEWLADIYKGTPWEGRFREKIK